MNYEWRIEHAADADPDPICYTCGSRYGCMECRGCDCCEHGAGCRHEPDDEEE